MLGFDVGLDYGGFDGGFDIGGTGIGGTNFYDPSNVDEWGRNPTSTVNKTSPTFQFSPTIRLSSGGTSGTNLRTQATNVVNQFEPYFKSNRDTYLNQPASRDAQIEALGRFDSLWNQLVQALSRLGAEGQAAIRDRSPGGGHNWYGYYRDPIERDQRLGPISGTQPGVTIPGTDLTIPTIPGLPTGSTGQLLTIAIIAVIAIVVIRMVK